MSKFKIGILCSEPVPIQKDIIGTGAGLRAMQLGTVLSRWAEVQYIVPEKKGIIYFHPDVHTYPPGRRELEKHIPAVDFLLAVQWPVVNLFREKPQIPLVIDFLSPLMLENQSLPGYNRKTFISTKIDAIRKADAFFASSARQMAYFLPWLNLAGFDLSKKDLIQEVPLLFDGLIPVKYEKEKPLQFVHTGYFWPWQETVPYLNLLADIAQEKGDSLVLYGGKHPYWDTFTGNYYDVSSLLEKPNVTLREPVPFSTLDRELTTNCIGVDLCTWNYERFLATPLKIAFYISKNMPFLAGKVYEGARGEWKKYGWTVSTNSKSKLKNSLYRLYPNIRRIYCSKLKTMSFETRFTSGRISSVLKENFFRSLQSSPPSDDAFYDFLPDYSRLKFEYGELQEKLNKGGLLGRIKNSLKKAAGKD